MKYYNFWVMRTPFKVTAFLVAFILTTFGSYSIINMDQGLFQQEVVPHNTSAYNFIKASDSYFGFYHMYAGKFSLFKCFLFFMPYTLLTGLPEVTPKSPFSKTSGPKYFEFDFEITRTTQRFILVICDWWFLTYCGEFTKIKIQTFQISAHGYFGFSRSMKFEF